MKNDILKELVPKLGHRQKIIIELEKHRIKDNNPPEIGELSKTLSEASTILLDQNYVEVGNLSPPMKIFKFDALVQTDPGTSLLDVNYEECNILPILEAKQDEVEKPVEVSVNQGLFGEHKVCYKYLKVFYY